MIKLPLFQGSRRWPHILRTSHFCISVSRNIFMKRKNNYYDDIMCTSRRCSSPKIWSMSQWNWGLCFQVQDSLISTDKAAPSHRLRLKNTSDDGDDDYQPSLMIIIIIIIIGKLWWKLTSPVLQFRSSRHSTQNPIFLHSLRWLSQAQLQIWSILI